MLRAENKQKDFFDDYIWRRALPEKHVLLDIKEKIDFSFVEEEVKDCYITPTRRGRPPYHPGILFRSQNNIHGGTKGCIEIWRNGPTFANVSKSKKSVKEKFCARQGCIGRRWRRFWNTAFLLDTG